MELEIVSENQQFNPMGALLILKYIFILDFRVTFSMVILKTYMAVLRTKTQKQTKKSKTKALHFLYFYDLVMFS